MRLLYDWNGREVPVQLNQGLLKDASTVAPGSRAFRFKHVRLVHQPQASTSV